MEPRDHFKNGASLKSQMNRGKKILFLFMACFMLCGSVHAQSDLSFNMWTGVRINGKTAKPKQIKEVLSVNNIALKQYNTGRIFEQVGGVVGGIGLGLCAVDMIKNFDDFHFGSLFFVGCATFGTSFAFLIPGTLLTGKAVRTYNSGLSSYKAPPSQLYFGFIPSGGVGLTMRF